MRLHKDAATQTEVWVKPMRDGSRAVVLLNRGPSATSISIGTADLGLRPANSYQALDLWAHSVQEVHEVLHAGVPGHGAAMFVVKPGKSQR